MTGGGDRPRELKWYHAGPILFGDWGTSRLYVLGLCFLFNRFASFWYMLAMSVLLVAVGWCATIACRLYPDGGGVYSAAKAKGQLLAIFGSLLLCADYVVTASLSALDAFHYLGLSHMDMFGIKLDALAAGVAILAIGALNILGPTKTGAAAMVIALTTVILTLVIAIASIPHLGSARLDNPFVRPPLEVWIGFTEIVLALSGVEAIAIMTGIMVQPVEKTARRAILPVMCEIVILNLILAAAMSSLPESILMERNEQGDLVHTGDMLKVIAKEYVGPAFATVSAVVFALLLVSAVNTAIGALVSILYMLSRDRELPAFFGTLNKFGMPIWPLAIAMILPAVVVGLFPDVESLAGLYAIGIVGALAIELGSMGTNRLLEMRRWERVLMLIVSALLVVIAITICIHKPHARGFALIVLVLGLAGRLATMVMHPATPLVRGQRRMYQSLAGASIVGVLAAEGFGGSTLPGFLVSAALTVVMGVANSRIQVYRPRILAYKTQAVIAAEAKPKRMMFPGKYKAKQSVMVATQGNPRLLRFALEECKSREAELQLLFIRHIAVTPMGEAEPITLAEDQVAQDLFEEMRNRAQQEGVPLKLLYGTARDVPDAILDMAVTHGANLLLLGSTRRGSLWKAMKGDVIQAVGEQLPDSMELLIYA